MTRQTTTPILHANLMPSARESFELVRLVDDGHIDLDPAYQRGEVWTVDQRVALIRSWLTGLPTGVIVLSSRDNSRWSTANGDVHVTGAATWAVVDGKQRLLAARAWFRSELAAPSSWFDPELVAETEQTNDGPYARFSGLTTPGQRKFKRRSQLQVAEFSTSASLTDEAAMYMLVNGGGTPQSDPDIERARSIAETPL